MAGVRESHRELVLRLTNLVMGGCGLAALASLTVLIGWPVTEQLRSNLVGLNAALLWIFVAQEALRIAVQENRWRYVRSRWVEVSLAALVVVERLAGPALVDTLGAHPASTAATATFLYLAGTQLTLLGVVGIRTLRRSHFLSGRGVSHGMVFILSFAFLIGVGTCLLKTPRATPEAGLSWVDALFTATSAVCVTGLTTVDVGTAFTSVGHWMILVLIQVGGLGIMTLTYFFAYFVAGGVSLRDRLALGDLLSEDNLSQVGTVLVVIIGFTFTVEALGALAIWASVPRGALEDPEFFALFHAVSAFCNAGFSTLSAGLCDPRVRSDLPFLSVIMALVVAGGIGFPVFKNLWQVLWEWVAFSLRLRRARAGRLTTHTRLALAVTVGLVVGGAGLLWLVEPAVADGAVPGWFAALFNSVTARTAGFAVAPMETLGPAAVVVMVFLMYVGGSPASTAGGVKTTTFGIALLALRRVIQGRAEITCYGREVRSDVAYRALAILVLSGAWIVGTTVVLSVLHPEFPLSDLLFETVSALSTVGLTRALTPNLGDPAKLVLVATMFVGRIGVLLFLVSFIPRRAPVHHRLPKANVSLT